MYRLIFQSGPQRGRRVAIRQGPVILGRHPDAVLRLPEPEIALQHALLEELPAGGVHLRRLTAEAAVTVNQQAVAEADLHDGDLIGIGPHILQLATSERAWVFQLHDPECRAISAELLALGGIAKAGFGLGDDRKRIIQKLGVQPQGILELNTVFRERGYRKDMGVKGAVAVLFKQRFVKSKKAATSNWANAQLTESQLVYAANDAYAAIRVFHALGLSGAA